MHFKWSYEVCIAILKVNLSYTPICFDQIRSETYFWKKWKRFLSAQLVSNVFYFNLEKLKSDLKFSLHVWFTVTQRPDGLQFACINIWFLEVRRWSLPRNNFLLFHTFAWCARFCVSLFLSELNLGWRKYTLMWCNTSFLGLGLSDLMIWKQEKSVLW